MFSLFFSIHLSLHRSLLLFFSVHPFSLMEIISNTLPWTDWPDDITITQDTAQCPRLASVVTDPLTACEDTHALSLSLSLTLSFSTLLIAGQAITTHERNYHPAKNHLNFSSHTYSTHSYPQSTPSFTELATNSLLGKKETISISFSLSLSYQQQYA